MESPLCPIHRHSSSKTSRDSRAKWVERKAPGRSHHEQGGELDQLAPHEHSGAREEIYLYVDLPDPNFAIHLNYWDFQNPEIVAMVREGDAVAIKKGYHYNVAAPGTVTTFVWMMAAIREEQDRVFTQVTVQPEFDGRFKLF